MAAYELMIRPSVRKDVKKIPGPELRKILDRIETLRENPRPPGSVKLSGKEYYRIRKGDYRIIYEIQDEVLVIIVIKIGHRRDIYR